MDSLKIKIPENKQVIDIDDLLTILKEDMEETELSKDVKIIKKEEYYCDVLSNFHNIKEINYNCKYDLEVCNVTLNNGNKYTIMQNDEETFILEIETIENYDNLVSIDCLKEYQREYNKDLDDYILELKQEKSIELKLDDNINNFGNLSNFKYLLGYVPNKIFDFREKEYKTKTHENYGNTIIRYRFVNEEDLTKLDTGFYQNTKIRIPQNNILRYGTYIFLKTIDNNCILIKNDKKLN